MIKKISFALAAVLIIASITFAQSKSLSYADVADNMNLDEKTSLFTQTYWDEVKGQDVYWIGEVFDVQGGRGKAVVYIADKARILYKGYNIVLTTYDVKAAGKLEIGQSVKFKGVLSKYKSKRGGLVIVYLDKVEFSLD